MQIAVFRDVMTGSLVEISGEPAASIFTTIKNRGKKCEKNSRKRKKVRKALKRATLESNHSVMPEGGFLRSFSVWIRDIKFFRNVGKIQTVYTTS